MKTPVEAPAVQPAPYSLLDTAEKLGWIVEGGDAHWEAGVTYLGASGGSADIWDETCSAGDTTARQAAHACDEAIDYVPVTVETGVERPASLHNFDDVKEQVTDLLAVTQAKQLESYLWDNPNGSTNYSLANVVNLYATGGNKYNPAAAIAWLNINTAANSNGAARTLHVPLPIAPLLDEAGLIEPDSDGVMRLRSSGEVVIIGHGYNYNAQLGVDPSYVNAPASSGWIIAHSGDLKVYFGELAITPNEAREALDNATNQITVYAERRAAVLFNTNFVTGIAVNIPTTAS